MAAATITRSRLGDESPASLVDPDEFRAAFLRLLDVPFFLETYGALVPTRINPKKVSRKALFTLYVKLVGEHSVSPNRDFVESFYLERHVDVAAAVQSGEYLCGFHHWAVHGGKEGRCTKPGSGPSADRRSLSDAVASLFDVDYYVETYMPASSGAISREEAIDHFIGNGFSKGIVPVAGEQFDEAFYLMYYPDIRAAKAEGTIPSGYAHYISTGRQEGRLPTHDLGRVLEAKLGLLAYPVGINRVSSLRARLRPISVQIAHGRRPVVNVFVPSIDPDLIFGGYIAFFHFLCRWAERGQRLRFIITEDGHGTKEWFLNGIVSRPRWVKAFTSQEYINLSPKDRALVCSADDICIAYSCWTAHDAWSVCQNLRQRFFYYFIQEFEPIFHEHDSSHFFASAAYMLPHIAIFNFNHSQRLLYTGTNWCFF